MYIMKKIFCYLVQYNKIEPGQKVGGGDLLEVTDNICTIRIWVHACSAKMHFFAVLYIAVSDVPDLRPNPPKKVFLPISTVQLQFRPLGWPGMGTC